MLAVWDGTVIILHERSSIDQGFSLQFTHIILNNIMTDFGEKIKLSYFDIQGVAERIRLAFVLQGIDFEDHRVAFPEWGAMKATTKFGQLPEMQIGSETITQSEPMLRYAAALPGKCPGLMPTEPRAALAVNEALAMAGDFDREWMPSLYIGMRPTAYGYPAEFAGTEEHKALVKKMRTDFVAEGGALDKWMAHYENQLGDNKFMCGNTVTIVDCHMVPQLAKYRAGFIDHIPADCLDKFPKITAYLERFLSIDEVKAYYAAQAAAKAAKAAAAK